MPAFAPVVAPDVFALRPDFRALSIFAEGVTNAIETPETTAALARACRNPCSEEWAEPHREAWRAAYRAFGAKPQRTPCSAEALLKRVQRDGVLPGISAVVDLYNAISLRYAIPVGGENAEAYHGAPHLVRAMGNEPFDTIQAGAANIEHPDPGEVAWRDELGITCRRWNWRQGTRTRLDSTTTRMWFVLEALDPMSDSTLLEAGNELANGLRELSPGAAISLSVTRR